MSGVKATKGGAVSMTDCAAGIDLSRIAAGPCVARPKTSEQRKPRAAALGGSRFSCPELLQERVRAYGI